MISIALKTWSASKAVRIRSLVWALAVIVTLVSVAEAQTFGAAGSPISTIQDRDYEDVFRVLRENGIDAYFPTFQYQEVPEALSLGFEVDFLPPCTADDRGFRALRSTGMKLIVPGELIYPDPALLPRLDPQEDPLLQIIKCAGMEGIAAVTSYDEAVLNGRSLAEVAALYAHLKAVAPALPVLMVHGPIVADRPEFSRPDLIDAYLAQIKAYSEFADVIGFDVYPYPAFLMQIATPFSRGAIVEETRVVAEYLSWMSDVMPDKRKLIVLQGFALSDLYSPDFLESNFSQDFLSAVKAPTEREILMMVADAKAHGAEFILWWGASALKSDDVEPWPAILGANARR